MLNKPDAKVVYDSNGKFAGAFFHHLSLLVLVPERHCQLLTLSQKSILHFSSQKYLPTGSLMTSFHSFSTSLLDFSETRFIFAESNIPVLDLRCAPFTSGIKGFASSRSGERRPNSQGQVCGGRPLILPRQGSADVQRCESNLHNVPPHPQHRQLPLRANHPAPKTGRWLLFGDVDTPLQPYSFLRHQENLAARHSRSSFFQPIVME